jgi:hypothetical protein
MALPLVHCDTLHPLSCTWNHDFRQCEHYATFFGKDAHFPKMWEPSPTFRRQEGDMNHALLLRTTSFGVIYGPHCHQVLAVLCMKTYTFLCKGKNCNFSENIGHHRRKVIRQDDQAPGICASLVQTVFPSEAFVPFTPVHYCHLVPLELPIR